MSGHIRQRSPGSWELRHRVDGKVRTATFRGTKREAAARLRELMTAADRGQHVDANRITVAEHVRARIKQWQAGGRFSGRTAEHYNVLAAEIERHVGSVLLQKLSTLDVERMHTAMRGKGLSRTTAAAHALLQRALTDAVKHKLVHRNVAREQGAPPAKRSAPVATLTSDQVKELLTKLAGDRWRVPVTVALYTGLRRGEQLGLRWSNVDLDAKTIRVRAALDETEVDGVTVKEPKSEAGKRDITLPAVVVDALRDHRRAQLEQRLLLGLGKPSGGELVFPGDDGAHQAPRAFSQRWGRMAARLGVPEVTWHALRHTHASMLISAGVDVVTVARRLGHADPSITLRVYAHLFTTTDAAAAAAIDAALG
jgi:integrase